jgi:hypothetical protein
MKKGARVAKVADFYKNKRGSHGCFEDETGGMFTKKNIMVTMEIP